MYLQFHSTELEIIEVGHVMFYIPTGMTTVRIYHHYDNAVQVVQEQNFSCYDLSIENDVFIQ